MKTIIKWLYIMGIALIVIYCFVPEHILINLNLPGLSELLKPLEKLAGKLTEWLQL